MKQIKFILLLFLLHTVSAQEKQIEDLLEAYAEASDQSELIENLESLKENPVDLNKASIEELSQLPFINHKHIQEIITYREKNGQFKSVEELLLLKNFDTELLESINQFIFTAPQQKSYYREIGINFRSRISRQLDKPVGYTNGVYSASVNKIYNRFQFQLGNKLFGGFLTEKDAGEQRLNDLNLFYLNWQINQNLDLIVGNYQLQFGQGLTFWGPYGYSKGANTIYPLKRKSSGFKKYLSVDENAGLLGTAIRINFGDFNIVPFLSRASLDASAVDEEAVSGISASGFHRTESEKARQDNQRETLVGTRIEYMPAPYFRIGGTTYFSDYKKSITSENLERGFFNFRGKSNHVAGFDLAFVTPMTEFFGEIARSKNGGNAMLAGMRFYESAMKFAFLFRKYDKDFQNQHSLGFGEGSNTQNETGFYSGIEYQLKPGTILAAYYDFYKFPWRTFFEPIPRAGNDFLIQMQHKLNHQTLVNLRYKQKLRQPSENYKDQLGRTKFESVKQLQKQYRLQVDYRATKTLLFRNRIDLTTIDYQAHNPAIKLKKESGILIYQDIRLQAFDNWRLWARYTFFGTDSFESRLFQFENDLPGVLTNRALFGQGVKWYVLLKYEHSKFIILNFKYSELYRQDINQLGSGNDLINGSLDRRFSAQLEGKF